MTYSCANVQVVGYHCRNTVSRSLTGCLVFAPSPGWKLSHELQRLKHATVAVAAGHCDFHRQHTSVKHVRFTVSHS